MWRILKGGTEVVMVCIATGIRLPMVTLFPRNTSRLLVPVSTSYPIRSHCCSPYGANDGWMDR